MVLLQDNRPSFLFSVFVLLALMAFYAVAGSVLLMVIPGGMTAFYDPVEGSSQVVSAMRFSQVAAQVLVLGLPVLLLAAMHTRELAPLSWKSLEFLGVSRSVSWRQLVFGVLGMISLQPLLYSVIELQDFFLWPALGAAGAEVIESRKLLDVMIDRLAGAHSIGEAAVVSVVLAFTPALCEELLFRGYLQQNWYRSLSPSGSVLFTGFVFAVFHLSVANLVPLMILGWYIGYIFMKSGNLAVPFSVHLFNNLAALVVLHAFGSSPEEPYGLIFSFWWWVAVAGGLLLFLFFIRRFRTACS
ncbi:MAG: CPBP family intramembrane metalloprotease [Chlorobium sp.]|jgi:membrane protease YdiL (CAAX protease family)|uniref:CPBP family intramembrane glutamic endopeptidase n=1 Tax=Chlorobium sp. TaxID=1095 RepID=UPI0025BC8B0A|nr:CPBP family intramembrane glutamic endopeptidase [Chlorobium sp.]MCF8216991.1 CPBP family intramembrane metalloprotease [Chlorobium sp.]MCF8271821.1 CPBP family intramembrane metalloprotease [Chlorobium sp.]MCF8288208.1 CPBP family intramembrane metalloprotease [Chlorobium sp.]MCF8291803.1 CPBP family intramembrane metalloprotease [Chlorobium sp.]MCF8385911.1 CPBP family intramembrane metalloprotease [Chlorobium sp.]